MHVHVHLHVYLQLHPCRVVRPPPVSGSRSPPQRALLLRRDDERPRGWLCTRLEDRLTSGQLTSQTSCCLDLLTSYVSSKCNLDRIDAEHRRFVWSGLQYTVCRVQRTACDLRCVLYTAQLNTDCTQHTEHST